MSVDWSYKLVFFVTDSEFKEIYNLLQYSDFGWYEESYSRSFSIPDKTYSYKSTFFITLYNSLLYIGPYYKDDYITELSKIFPSSLFYYYGGFEKSRDYASIWFCNGKELYKSFAFDEYEKIKKEEVKRFISNTSKLSKGVSHTVELLPNGNIKCEGFNRFEECNTSSWENIKAISCGNWHTVGLKKDGTLVACGMNANGQCDGSSVKEKVIDISCGRYHTAVLLENGKVQILGNLEQKAKVNPNISNDFNKPDDLPLTLDLILNKNIVGWKEMNKHIEDMSEGDELILDGSYLENFLNVEVYNSNNQKIGAITHFPNGGLIERISDLKATVDTVIPVSKRTKKAKYAKMTVKLEYLPSLDNDEAFIGNYVQTPVETWPQVAKIKSIYDAVIGITKDGEIYIDGFCPCSEDEILLENIDLY